MARDSQAGGANMVWRNSNRRHRRRPWRGHPGCAQAPSPTQAVQALWRLFTRQSISSHYRQTNRETGRCRSPIRRVAPVTPRPMPRQAARPDAPAGSVDGKLFPASVGSRCGRPRDNICIAGIHAGPRQSACTRGSRLMIFRSAAMRRFRDSGYLKVGSPGDRTILLPKTIM